MKCKRGFTLIELVVAIVMACVLLAALTPLLTLAQNGTYTAQRSTRAAQAGDAIYEYISSLLKNAERVYIGDGGTYRPAAPDTWNQITVSPDRENGVLTVNGASVYPLDYQEGCALTMSATGQSRDQLTLSVILADNRSSDVLYSKQSAFTLAGLEAGGFGQTEGLVGGAVLADGFGGTQTVGSAAGVGPLVIYYKGGGSLVPDFNPAPGGDHADPTPGPSAFSVTLPARIEVEQGEQDTLKGYVTWPDGLSEAEKVQAVTNARWELTSPSGAADYLGVTPSVTSAPGLEAWLYGQQITDAVGPVTIKVTLSVTVNGSVLTASDTCLVSVWKTSPLSGDFVLVQSAGDGWNGKPNLSGQTIFLNFEDYKKGKTQLLLSVYSTDGNFGANPLHGGFTSSDHSILPDYSTQTIDNFAYKQNALSSGKVRLTFTASGHVSTRGDTIYEQFKGRQAYVDIVFYEPGDLSMALRFSENGAPTYTAAISQIGQIAATAKLTLKYTGTDAAIREAFVSEFSRYYVQLTNASPSQYMYTLWQSYSSHLENPTPARVRLSIPQTDGSFVWTVPLTVNQVQPGKEMLTALIYTKESVSEVAIGQFMLQSNQAVLTLTRGPIINQEQWDSYPDLSGSTITMKKNSSITFFAHDPGIGKVLDNGSWSVASSSTASGQAATGEKVEYGYRVSSGNGAQDGTLYTVTYTTPSGIKSTVTIKIIS